MKLYRSVLFVPGNRPDWIDKAPKYGPDALIIDLEDAVPIAEKIQARPIVRAGIERLRDNAVGVFVRVNGLDTGLTGEDVEAIVTAGLDGIAIPKLENADEIRKIDAWIELFERKAGLDLGTVEIMAIPETAKGIMNAYELASACPRRRSRDRRRWPALGRCHQGGRFPVDPRGAGEPVHGLARPAGVSGGRF